LSQFRTLYFKLNSLNVQADGKNFQEKLKLISNIKELLPTLEVDEKT